MSLERSHRTEAESELASSKALFNKESQLILAKYEALVVARREAESEHAKDKDVLMIAGREADRRLMSAVDNERTLKRIIDEKEQNRQEIQASLELAFQEGRTLQDKKQKQ